jgi:hypothetical protein
MYERMGGGGDREREARSSSCLAILSLTVVMLDDEMREEPESTALRR